MDIEDLSSESNQCSTCHLAREIPEIPVYAPFSMRNLIPGKTYIWCSCGVSKTPPLCDNSHKKLKDKPRFVPVKFTASEQRLYLICGCKYTRRPPFCDGFHGTMDAIQTTPPCKW
jgi:CDGSH-type Zn-finger protein